MHYVPFIGSTSLGIVIGFLVRYFVRRFDSWSAKGLSSVISLIVGGAVIRFLEADRTVWWFYPIGLLIGFIAYQIIATRAIQSDREWLRDWGQNQEDRGGGGYRPGPNDPRFGSRGDDPR